MWSFMIYRQKNKYIFIVAAGYIEKNEYHLLWKYFYVDLQWYLYVFVEIHFKFSYTLN